MVAQAPRARGSQAAQAHGAESAMLLQLAQGAPDGLVVTDLDGLVQAANAEFLTLCPWHQDSNASLTVSPRTNRVHCFVCNRGADPIGWLQERLSRSPRPCILVFEDVHWADEATLDLVKVLARRIVSLPVVMHSPGTTAWTSAHSPPQIIVTPKRDATPKCSR